MQVDLIQVKGDIVLVRYRNNGGYHRKTISPFDDYSGEPAEVRAICEATFTPPVVTAYRDKQIAAEAALIAKQNARGVV